MKTTLFNLDNETDEIKRSGVNQMKRRQLEYLVETNVFETLKRFADYLNLRGKENWLLVQATTTTGDDVEVKQAQSKQLAKQRGSACSDCGSDWWVDHGDSYSCDNCGKTVGKSSSEQLTDLTMQMAEMADPQAMIQGFEKAMTATIVPGMQEATTCIFVRKIEDL